MISLKRYCLLPGLFIWALAAGAQKGNFDLVTYHSPPGWKKQNTDNALQLSKENPANGAYCLVTVFKSMPGSADAKTNFDAAWETVVKGMVKTTGAPEMQPAAKENGWEALSGYSPFESEGQKGIALLVTSTGFEKMVNLLVLTNSNEFEKELTTFLESITLAKPEGKPNTGSPVSKTGSVTPAPQTPPNNSEYAFTTTNFDDGWTSTVQEDWVKVTKGSTTVLIHYPHKKADAYNSVLMDGLKNAWNVLVAPRYSSAYNFAFKPITGWQSVEFAEADAVENATGKTVHVVLFKMNYSNGSGRYLEFITPSKNAFEQEFGAYHETSYGWEKMENMALYNKFAVAATDLKGKWTSDFSGMQQYVNAYTGASAGADTHASSESFVFTPGNTYKWDLGVAGGFVGNIKFQSVKSGGKFSLPNNWQVAFSDIEGKPKTCNVYFSCVKGARILWIGNTGFGRSE